MKEISIDELINNVEEYTELAKYEDFKVTNKGEIAFYIKSLKTYKSEAIKRLKGAVITDIPYEDILKGKLNQLQ